MAQLRMRYFKTSTFYILIYLLIKKLLFKIKVTTKSAYEKICLWDLVKKIDFAQIEYEAISKNI